MSTEVAGRADFATLLRYAQVWEDADVLLEGLAVGDGDCCLSIASAGDNALAMLAAGAGRVIAVDLNPAQLAAVALRVAAYRTLDHPAFLELIGARPSTRRGDLYARCRPALPADARAFWDARPEAVRGGVGGAGKFERYFALFRRRVLPLVHGRRMVRALVEPRDAAGRHEFYERRWNTLRWRLLFRLFFSRAVMGRLGRDPALFAYVEGSPSDHILRRTRHALVELEPADNPYLHWILTGTYGEALPHALRREHFERIRDRLDRLELHGTSLESLIAGGVVAGVDRANLSDIFEYMSADAARTLFERLADAARPGGRLAYWNLLVPRRGAELVPGRLRRLDVLSDALHRRDRTWFYGAFHVDEVIG